jgi:AcrR family transcriptional regulator
VSVDGTRRTEILETAASLLASNGLRTSLKQIADACGILPGSLYHHFDSKEAIIVELIERYRADLDAVAERALDDLSDPGPAASERIATLVAAIAACAVRHRAAVLLTFYEPPTGAGDELLRVARRTPQAIETAMHETLRLGQETGYIRPGIDLSALADRLLQTMLYMNVGVFPDVPGAEALPTIRCRILLEGVAVTPPTDAELDASPAFAVARQVVASWADADDEGHEKLAKLRAVARTEFGRRGYEATTVRDIAAAADMSTGTVYRLIGSKDQLLASIMRSFDATGQPAWRRVLATDATSVEKLDALMWININVVTRFSDEYNICLAWFRESPPKALNLASTFAARLRDLKALIGQGVRAGEIRIEGPSADMRAWSLFDLTWMHENLVGELGPEAALGLARDTVLRGASAFSTRKRSP